MVGGVARAASMTPEERRQLASKGAKARWKKASEAKALQAHSNLPVAKYKGILPLGDVELPDA